MVTVPGRPGSNKNRAVRPDDELRFRLSKDEIEQLKRVADARNTSIDDIARELVRNHLKLLP